MAKLEAKYAYCPASSLVKVPTDANIYVFGDGMKHA